MKIAGFIAEFNPFHEGHKYFINKIKEDNVDYVVCAMSPNFVMRGEPAIFNKFERTEIALLNGCDCVFEIPTIYTIESADIYAKAGITILNRAGITDLYFGSEIDNIELFDKVIEIENSNEYKELLHKYLKEGYSFNQSSKKAITYLDKSLEEYLLLPNFLLGIEYIKSIKEINNNINIHIIKRIESGYYESYNESKNIQSASALRSKMINGNNKNEISYYGKTTKIHEKNNYINLIKYKIDSSTISELREINGVTEGIENKIKKATKANTFKDLYDCLVSKRNRETKINRILFSILLNIKKDEIDFNIDTIRILGFNSMGRKFLRSLTTKTVSTINKDVDPKILRELDFTKIYDIYNESLVTKEYKPVISDLTES